MVSIAVPNECYNSVESPKGGKYALCAWYLGALVGKVVDFHYMTPPTFTGKKYVKGRDTTLTPHVIVAAFDGKARRLPLGNSGQWLSFPSSIAAALENPHPSGAWCMAGAIDIDKGGGRLYSQL